MKEEEKQKKGKDIEANRKAASLALQRVREKIAEQFRLAAHEKQYGDMVIERELPTLGYAFRGRAFRGCSYVAHSH